MKPTLLFLLLLLRVGQIQAQNYPLQATVQLIPPYSVYLSDYGSNEKLRLILLQKDLTKPAYQIRLRLSVSLNGKLILQTSQSFNPPPLTLDPGIPVQLSGADLMPYVESRNLDFIAYDRTEYERTRALPEGAYTISITAFDYHRQSVQVSNEGTAFYFLFKSEPPLLNTPACGSLLPANPAFFKPIVFSWLPRNTASLNSSLNSEYEFALYQVLPWGRNPNDVVLTSQPIFKTRTQLPQYIYSLSDPALIDSSQYVWRVQALDTEGKDAFRNNGFSQPCLFTYGGRQGRNISIGIVNNLIAIAETESRAKASWQANSTDFDSYRVEYKSTKEGFEWFNIETKDKELKLFDLAPDSEFEVRVQGRKDGFLGDYSPLVKFRTPPKKTIVCGEPTTTGIADPGKPFTGAVKGMIVVANEMQVTLTSVTPTGQPGFYAGTGTVQIPFLAGADFGASFSSIYINEDRQVTLGRIDLNTTSVQGWIEEEREKAKQNKDTKEKALQQEANIDKFGDLDFSNNILLFENIAFTSVTLNADGSLSLVSDNGKTYKNNDLVSKPVSDKPVIIQDKNGDQWVILNGKVEVAKGGGLPPYSKSLVSKEVLDIVKKALKALRSEYNTNLINSLVKDTENKKSDLQKLIDKENNRLLNSSQNNKTTADSLFSGEFMLSTDSTEQDENPDFVKKSIAFKVAERKQNKAQVIQLLAQESRTKREITFIAINLFYKEEKIDAFLTKEKQKGTPEDIFVTIAQTAIVDFVNKILDDYLYQNSK